MAKAFVTGANGFIGSHLVRELLRRGYEVNGLVRHTSDISSLRGLPIALYTGDVREPETLVAPMKGVDYVFHLAAELMVTSRDAFEEANTRGTLNVLEAAEAHAGNPLKRFLLVSSQAAAGPGQDPSPVDETKTPDPISWYGSSKKQAEDAAHRFADRLPVTIVRPSSVYGEHERDISQVFGVVASRLHPILGIRKKYVVMVYVGDLVRGIVDAAESGNTVGETYFLNHPEALTSGDVVRTIAKAMGKPFGLPLPVPTFVIGLMAPLGELVYHVTRNRPQMTRDKAREVGQRFWVADPSKARRDFGWEANLSLLDGMKKTIPFFRAERARIKALEGEGGLMLWLKHIIVAMLIGTMIETTSKIGQFYTFDPLWGIIPTIIGMFGIGLGTVAMAFRKRSSLLAFMVGTVAATGVEILNQFKLIPFFYWEFAEGWPLGITNPWVRSILLSLAAGVVVLLTSAVMRALYKRRLRLG
ncbi:MAG: NAD-dependent epimerase/dehydratase family protein [Rhodothermales bacterium]